MWIRYSIEYADGKFWNEQGIGAWKTEEGKSITQRINELVEEIGLVRENVYRSPETVDINKAIRFLTACNELSTPTIKVEAKLVCPVEFHEETLREYYLDALSPVTIGIVDEKGYSPGFVWQGCKWAWQDFDNKRSGTASSKGKAIAALIESLKSSSTLEIFLDSEIQQIIIKDEDVFDLSFFE